MSVSRAHMQPRHVADAAMIAHHLPHQRGGIPLAAMFGMGAHAAHFWIAVEHHPLAAHRNQLATREHAVIAAHLTSLRTKKAGKGEVSQRDHRRSVGTGKWND